MSGKNQSLKLSVEMWNLNRFLFSVIVLVTCMSITHAKEARDDSTTDGLHRERSDEPGFVQLFNGKDLSGSDRPPDCLKVRENAIW